MNATPSPDSVSGTDGALATSDVAKSLGESKSLSAVPSKRLQPQDNKFHKGAKDGKHYWLTPKDLYKQLDDEFHFDFDPAPYPKPDDFDGLTDEWGQSNYVNPPFGSMMHEGKRKGQTAWARKSIEEYRKGKRVVMVYPIDKWVLMLIEAGAQIRNLGDVQWVATEDKTSHKGMGRHIACFILDPDETGTVLANTSPEATAAPLESAKATPTETAIDNELKEILTEYRDFALKNMPIHNTNDTIKQIKHVFMNHAKGETAILEARIDTLEKLKQYHGAYISIDGKRVDNMVHHSIIDEHIKELQAQLQKDKS